MHQQDGIVAAVVDISFEQRNRGRRSECVALTVLSWCHSALPRKCTAHPRAEATRMRAFMESRRPCPWRTPFSISFSRREHASDIMLIILLLHALPVDSLAHYHCFGGAYSTNVRGRRDDQPKGTVEPLVTLFQRCLSLCLVLPSDRSQATGMEETKPFFRH